MVTEAAVHNIPAHHPIGMHHSRATLLSVTPLLIDRTTLLQLAKCIHNVGVPPLVSMCKDSLGSCESILMCLEVEYYMQFMQGVCLI